MVRREAAEPPKNDTGAKPAKAEDDRRAVSTYFPSKLAQQLRLLASVTRESVSAIVIASVSRTLAKKLRSALP